MTVPATARRAPEDRAGVPDAGMAPPDVAVERREDGTVVLRSRQSLAPYAPNLGALLRRWAVEAPSRVLVAERSADGDGWREVGYADALAAAESIGQALLDRGLGPERPVLVLSGNSVDHALVMFGCYVAGVPVAPVSVPYSLQSRDFGKLRAIAQLVAPGLVLAEHGAPFAPALAALREAGVLPEVVTSAGAVGAFDATPLADLLATVPGEAVRRAVDAVGSDEVAKILFTSGSTGDPKGVVNTHGMLCANQQSLAQIWPFLAETPPVLCDWLPWSHTFGGNHDLHLVLQHGGSLYVDAGKPAPALVGTTVRNLADVGPTIWFNVPAGFAAALPHLERDRELAARAFRRLQLIFYAAAALPQDVWERLERLAVEVTGRRIPMTSSWGSTETAPLATSAHFPLERAGTIGVPVPGVELKVVPAGAKLELRVRGPNVTPGYWRRPDLTTAAFDDECFYRIGDAGRFVDPDDPARGLLFDGRIAEDFKLTSGTWVHCGEVRIEALAAASPLLQDAVVAGADRDAVALLAWLNAPEAARVAGASTDAPADELDRHPEVRRRIVEGLQRHNAANPGSATAVTRVLLLREPASIDAGEITDKGYLNQRRVLELRAGDVDRLYANDPDDDVLVVAGPVTA